MVFLQKANRRKRDAEKKVNRKQAVRRGCSRPAIQQETLSIKGFERRLMHGCPKYALSQTLRKLQQKAQSGKDPQAAQKLKVVSLSKRETNPRSNSATRDIKRTYARIVQPQMVEKQPAEQKPRALFVLGSG